MPDPRTVELPDGRLLAYDDLGDPAGVPVAYHHGTPDSRRARHPDDDLAAAAGVRLLAIDRPGIGGSSPHPTRTLGSFADDLLGFGPPSSPLMRWANWLPAWPTIITACSPPLSALPHSRYVNCRPATRWLNI